MSMQNDSGKNSIELVTYHRTHKRAYICF